jgi:hypothetical protein
MERLEAEDDSVKLMSEADRLKKEMEKFYNQGLISQEEKEKAVEELENMKNILLFGMKMKEILQKAREGAQTLDYKDYRKAVEELLESTSLPPDKKELLRQMFESISQAQTMSQLEGLKESVERQMQSLLREGLSKEEVDKIRELFMSAIEIQKMFIVEKAFTELRKKIDDLKRISPQDAVKIRSSLEKIRSAGSKEELKEQLDSLSDYLSAKAARSGKAQDADAEREKQKLLQRLLVVQDKVVDKFKGQDPRESAQEYERQLKASLDETPGLKDDKKDELGGKLDELMEAGTFSQVDRLESEIKKELDSLQRAGAGLKETQEMKDALGKMGEIKKTSLLEEDFTDLARLLRQKETISQQESSTIDDALKKIPDVSSKEETKEQTEALKDYLSADTQRAGTAAGEQEVGDLLKEMQAARDSALEKIEKDAAKREENAYRKDLKDALKESSIPERKKLTLENLIDELLKTRSASLMEKIKENLERELEMMIREGIKEEDVKEIHDIYAAITVFKEKEVSADKKQVYSKDWHALLISISELKEIRRDELARIAEELFGANTLMSIERTEKLMADKLDEISKEGVSYEDRERLQLTFAEMAEVQKDSIIEKELFEALESLGQMEELTPQDALAIKEAIEKISRAKSKEEIKKETDALRQRFSSEMEEAKKKEKSERVQEADPWKIYVLPSQLVLGRGNTVSLKAIAVYNDLFARELSQQVEWFSSDGRVAVVDQKGNVRAVTKGKAILGAKYRDKMSSLAEIVVVEEVKEGLDVGVKEELLQKK